jgi:hypothetical protein
MMSINPCDRTASATSWNRTPRTVDSHESFSSLHRIAMQYTTIGIHCQSSHYDKFDTSQLSLHSDALAELNRSKNTAQLRITAVSAHRRPSGGSGFGALRRAPQPHGPSALLASGPRRITAARYVKHAKECPGHRWHFPGAKQLPVCGCIIP